MAMFQQYQNGVTPVTGMSEAGANIGKMYMQGIGQFGESLSKGLQAYNDNSAKNEILTEEAKVLGSQIQQYAQMFGNSPEHAEFSASLQPYIDQLAKVPSMSLTQKMGAVTGVKAGFANIGQQLQVFELMRGERMKRDINTARGGVKEFDEVTVPTAIIPSGKLPYFYDKTYVENESEVTRLATEAKLRGANVDITKVLSDWRNDFKASAMARTDMPPEVKEALVKQIDAGQNLVDNIQTDETTGVTDYAKEAGMYERTVTSVKDQLAPKKVEPASAESVSDGNKKNRIALQEGIAKLQSIGNSKTETISDSEFNKLVDKDPSGSRFTKVTNLENQGWKKSNDAKGNQVWTRTTKDETISKAIDIYKSELAKIPSEKKSPKSGVSTVNVDETKTQLADINKQIADLDTAIEQGDDLALGRIRKTGNFLIRKVGDLAEVIVPSVFKNAVLRSGVDLNDEEAVRKVIQKTNRDNYAASSSIMLAYQDMILSSNPIGASFSRDITKRQEALIESEVQRELVDYGSKLDIAKFTGDTEGQKQALSLYKSELENRLLTGKVNAQASDVSKAQQAKQAQQGQQAGATAETKPETSYTLTNQRNMSLGTTTQQVASSVESKRTDMKNFFTKKYGYVPASFEESFKAIYPEANFKTMETPYGAFMHDGKEWKQIQMQQPKVMSNKEIAEEKSVTFGQPNASGGLEFSELVPKSGIYVRGIFAGTPTEAFKFRTEMLETANAKVAVTRLIEINDMVGESMPWNASLWGEAKALLPQIKAGLRTDIIGVGTVSNYEQQLIEDVVADPTKFWSLESSDRAKLAEIMRRVNNRMTDKPALYGLEVRKTGQSNAEIEKSLRMGRTGKSKLELDFEARGGKKGTALEWNLTNKIPDALK